MNILFLTPQLPYPGNSGGTIKSRHLLDYLCLKHTVTLVSLIKKSDRDSLADFQKEYTSRLKNFFYFEVDKSRTVINYLMSIVSNMPLGLYRNADMYAKRKIRQVIKTNSYDAIFCDHLLMAQYIPQLFYHKAILHEHNVEYMIWQRYACLEKNIIKKIIAGFESYRMFRYEIKTGNAVPFIMAAPHDIQILKSNIQHSGFTITYHLGFDEALRLPTISNIHSHRLLFIGTMTWDANVNGINWFVNNVYSQIKTFCPDVSLWIAGKYNIPPIQTDDDSIHLLGFVDNLDELYRNADVFICPLQYGSGMKVKNLDAMYRGLPIVTTSIGAESIDLVDGENCFIAETADDFAKKIIILLNDAAIWDQFSKNSRALAEKQYRWESEFERFEELLGKI